MGNRMNWSRAIKFRPLTETELQRRLDRRATQIIANGASKPAKVRVPSRRSFSRSRKPKRRQDDLAITDGMNPDGTLRVFTGEAARRQFNAPWD